MGFLHSFTTGSAVDGPGVRVVAWTTGCMWRCLYCHNPDTWTMSNGMPVTVAQAVGGAAQVPPRPQGHVGRLHAERRRAADAGSLRRQAASRPRKAMGIHTAIETNGYYGERLSDAELETDRPRAARTSRRWDPERHRRLTGMDIGPTLEFARRLAARARPIWVRFVLVPGLTDDLDDVAQIADFAAGLGNVERVDVLPFHQMGRFKWEQLGLDYTLDDVEPPSPEAVERACAVFRAVGLKAY